MDEVLASAFSSVISESLRNGNALILIDGLDEITNDGDRVSFVSALRTFLGTYATVPLVVTSREAGFRLVGGALGGECERFRIADFDSRDIHLLVASWHREVYGDSVTGRRTAAELAETIVKSDRIRRLAGNPMLLTTLLLVKRWVGQLPTKRTVLYDKAIEVLLMTWNVQAHAPIGLDEALPRLEFVAFAMMKEGSQNITRTKLQSLLRAAREELPEALGYSQLSDSEFIDRVEFRSSLLIQAGHALENGRLVPLYEFRHLTFQEYLVARTIIDGYYSGRKEEDTPAKILAPYLDQETWREVIPITAVLAGRDAKGIVSELIGKESDGPESRHPFSQRGFLLVQCLLDEVQLAPSDVDRALLAVSRSGHGWTTPKAELLGALAIGKFGKRLHEITADGLRACDRWAAGFGSTLAHITAKRLALSDDALFAEAGPLDNLCALLDSIDPLDQASGALVVMGQAFSRRMGQRFSPRHDPDPILIPVGDKLPPLLSSPHDFVQFAASWALAWLGPCGWDLSRNPETLIKLMKLWCGSQNRQVRRQATWATCSLPLFNRQLLSLSIPDSHTTNDIADMLSEPVIDGWPWQVSEAALTIAYYFGSPFSDAELIERVVSTAQKEKEHPQGDKRRQWAAKILSNLGQLGAGRLQELGWDKENETERESS